MQEPNSMYKVNTDDYKTARINVKLSKALREEFHIAAKLKGGTVSGLIHQFIVATVREEKKKEPQAFTVDNALLPNQLELPDSNVDISIGEVELRKDSQPS